MFEKCLWIVYFFSLSASLQHNTELVVLSYVYVAASVALQQTIGLSWLVRNKMRLDIYVNVKGGLIN